MDMTRGKVERPPSEGPVGSLQWKASLEVVGAIEDDVVGRIQSIGSGLTGAELIFCEVSDRSQDI